MSNGSKTQARPQARDDSAVVSEDGYVVVDVLANDRGNPQVLWSVDQDDLSHQYYFDDLPSGAIVQTTGIHHRAVYKTNGAFDYLAEGETATDSFTYSIRLGDGTISTATVNILIIGVNDPTQIESVRVGLVEGDDAADISTSGQLAISDPDSPATVVPYSRQGEYGTFTIDSDGSWTYEADGPHDEFEEGKTYSEIFRVDSSDGTGKATVIIEILGADEPAMLGAMAGPDLVVFA